MRIVKILSMVRMNDAEKDRISAIHPGIELIDAGGWFDGEIRETWPEYAANRYLPAGSNGSGTRAERDALLAEAEIILGGFPPPFDIRARAPKLKWFHQRPAGASNLFKCDLWGSDVVVSTSRGYGNTLPIAEWALSGMMYFAKGFHQAETDANAGTFDNAAYAPLLIQNKTVCVIGAGGIGRDLGRICAALGMRVVGTRRKAPATGDPLPEGFSALRGAEDLHDLLAQSDFVAVCCHWTPDTTGLMNAAAFNAMKPGAILVNVARGEIVNEDDLLAALDCGQLRGAALDVYDGEFEKLPDPRLWQRPDVLITPHNSGGTDVSVHRAFEIFREYLTDYLHGKPVGNVIDWDRGY
jgi:phosphoglycerate dehydrogenase-like enzyme